MIDPTERTTDGTNTIHPRWLRSFVKHVYLQRVIFKRSVLVSFPLPASVGSKDVNDLAGESRLCMNRCDCWIVRFGSDRCCASALPVGLIAAEARPASIRVFTPGEWPDRREPMHGRPQKSQCPGFDDGSGDSCGRSWRISLPPPMVTLADFRFTAIPESP